MVIFIYYQDSMKFELASVPLQDSDLRIHLELRLLDQASQAAKCYVWLALGFQGSDC